MPLDERDPKSVAAAFKIEKSQLFEALMKDIRPRSAQQNTERLEANPEEKIKSVF